MGDIQIRRPDLRSIEWWISMYGPYGGRIGDVYLAADWARQELKNRGVPDVTGDYDNHIKIKPGDGHVIVYIEFDDEEQKP